MSRIMSYVLLPRNCSDSMEISEVRTIGRGSRRATEFVTAIGSGVRQWLRRTR